MLRDNIIEEGKAQDPINIEEIENVRIEGENNNNNKEEIEKPTKGEGENNNNNKEETEKPTKGEGENNNNNKEETEKPTKGEGENNNNNKEEIEKPTKGIENEERGDREREDREIGDGERDDIERGDREREDRERADRERGDRERGDREREDRERADRERGDRERGDREREDREREAREREAREREAREREAREREAREREAREREAREREAREREAREREAREREAREREAREREAREREAREREAREREVREREAREREAREREAREREAREREAREREAREREAREREAREREAREREAREREAREREAREREAREREAREREDREREAREKEAREREPRERKARERQDREREAREREPREREPRERQEREREERENEDREREDRKEKKLALKDNEKENGKGETNKKENSETDNIVEVPGLEEEHKAEEEEEEEQADRKNLMFEQKSISAGKLYCHLSEGFEVLLMILGIIGSAGSGVAGPLMTYLFGDLINKFSNMNNRMESGESIEDIQADMTHTIDDMVRKLLYIGVGMFVAGFLANSMWSYVGLRQIEHMKEKYFATILKQEQGWFDENNAFEFSTKVQAQLEQVELGLGDKFGLVIQMIGQLICGFVIAFISSWDVTLIMFTIAPFIFICIIYLVTSLKRAIVLSRKTYEHAGGVAEEMLYNIKTVASFVNFKFETDRFGHYVDKVHGYELEKAFKLGISLGGILFFLNFTFVVAILYTRRKIANDIDAGKSDDDRFQVGDALTCIFSTIMAIMSIGSVAPNLKIIQEAAAASSDYFTLYEREPKIVNAGKFKPDRDSVKGKIEFKDITFIYPSDKNERKILDGLNLLFEPGKKVALVGESGCGKSTTINMIERLYEPVKGQVLIDDVDIKEYDLPYLRSLIGYVQQEPVLFNKPIRDNLIFGRYDVVKSLGDPEKLMDEACEEAYAKEFINKNPEKYNYIVGIKGSKLSGGQKQRIAIARAILCKPKILILDEATSALDNKSEKEVQRALDHISERAVTTVIIAHRLSTIKNADLIYAIKDGKVYEQGTHKELLAKNGYYAGLVKSQLAQDELESKEDNLPSLQRKKSSVRRLSRMASKNLSSHISQSGEVFDEQAQLRVLEKPKIKVDHGRLFALLSDHKCDAFLGDFGALGAGAMTVIQGFVLAKSINALSEATAKDVRDDGLFWAMMFLVVALANALFIFLKVWKFVAIGAVITTKMRKKVLAKYLQLHIGYFDVDENAPGALLTKLSIDTTQLNSIILSVFGELTSVFGTAVTGLAMGFVYSWRLTLINICFLPFIVIAQIFINQTRRGGRDKDKKIDIEAGSVLSECVINTKTIYSFNFQKPAVDMYLGILEASTKSFAKDSFLKGFFAGIGQFAIYASNATIFHYAFMFINDGRLVYDNMNVALNCVMMLTSGISQSLTGITDYSKAKKAFQSVYATLDTKTLIDPTEEANANKISAENVKGKIEFKNVTFAYPTKPDQKILKNISFTIEAGQSCGLVGYSGCGKSTIIQLIERYYDADEGEVLIDGVNVKDYNLLELRKKIGLVQQEPVLFKRSVYENILYGRLDATREEVFNAAKMARIEKFFNKKEMGTKEDPVSGGEKQRLAIARAFLKNPAILLLDEATSALDKESEIEVQKSIDVLQQGRTSVAVAHRLSTIEGSDVIFVLEAGKIVERGTHKELMALGGKYATLHKYSEQ